MEKEKKKRSSTSEQSKSPALGFSKFEEKKRQQTDKKAKYFIPVFSKSSTAKGNKIFYVCNNSLHL